MAKITNKEITGGKNPFEDLIDGAKTSLEFLELVEEQLKVVQKQNIKIAKQNPFKNFKSLKDSQKALIELAKAQKILTQIQTEKTKKSVQEEKLLQAQIKSEGELAAAIQKENKALQENVKLKQQETKARQENEKVKQQELKTEQEVIKSISEEEKLKQQSLKTDQAVIKSLQDEEKLKQQGLKTDQAVIKSIQDEEKLNQQIAKGRRAELKEKERLAKIKKRELTQQEKLNKKNKEQSRLSVKLRKDLVELKKKYKDLTLAEGLTADGADELKKEITDLDKRLQDVDKSLENVEEGTKTAAKGFKGIGLAIKAVGIGFIIAAIAKVADQFRTSREGALEFSKALGRGIAFVKVFAQSLINALGSIKQLFTGTFGAISNQFSIVGKKAQVLALDIAGIFSSDAEKKAAKLKLEIKALEENNFSLSEAIADVTSSFDGYSDRVDAVIASNDILLDQTLKYTIEIERLERSLAALTQKQELANATADDATLSFKERVEASKEVAKINTDIANQEEAIAEKRLQLSEQQLRTELAQSGITANSRQELLRILSDQTLALKVSDDASREFTDNFIALQSARTASQVAGFEQEKQLRELNQDLFEQELDFLFDVSDIQKTINEQRISNEKLSFQQRRIILDETNKLLDESFDQQIKLFEAENGIAIERNKLLELNNKEIFEYANGLGFSEIVTQRLLEVIRERRIAVQDLTVANEELTDSEREALEIRRDIVNQELALEGTTIEKIEQLEDDRLQTAIDNLKERLALAEDGSLEALKIEQELNDKLIDQNQKRLDAEKEAEDKALEEDAERVEKRKELQLAAIDFVSQITEAAGANRLKKLDEELEATATRQQELLQKANEGVLGAEESLAVEQAKNAKLKLARQKEEQKQEQFSAFLELLTAGIEAGKTPAEAFQNAGSILAAAPAFVNALPGLYEGTDGKTVSEVLGSPHLNTSKDAYISRLDGDEIVLDGKDSSLIPKGMTGQEIGRAAQQAHYNKTNGQTSTRFVNDPALIAEMQLLRKEVKAQPKIEGVDYDIMNSMVNVKIRENNKLLEKQYKISRVG